MSYKIDPTLAEFDPEMNELLERERTRQFKGLELIASENFTSGAVMEVLGSHFTNKYSEGLPGARYYGGNEFIDQVEQLCQKRALAAFGLDPTVWGVNVQPYSGSPANLAAYMALLQPHDRMMGLALTDGGHLTHGFYRGHKKITASATYYESMPYHVDAATGYIDYARMEAVAADFCPKLIVSGGSAYPREWDYKRMRALADSVGALFMCDMAHISGLVAGKVVDSPFEYAHVVTSTTHKTLRGPRSGIIFYRKDKPKDLDLETLINNAVFPGSQGGPHNNAIGALAVQLKEVGSPQWQQYAQQVKLNAAALGAFLKANNQKIVTDGTDNHLVLWDLRPIGLTGSKMEAVCDVCAITINKNTIHGDKSALTPGGVRLGSPALTSRGFVEKDFETVGGFLLRALQIALEVQSTSGKKLDDFKKALVGRADCEKLKHEVEAFASTFSMPGLDPAKLKYQ